MKPVAAFIKVIIGANNTKPGKVESQNQLSKIFKPRHWQQQQYTKN